MAEKTLIQLLIDLGSDVTKLEAFNQDPDTVLAEYDLTDAEIQGVKEALRTGDPRCIRDLMSDEDKKHPNVNVNIIGNTPS